MAFFAHMLGVIGIVGFFEFLWYLERWNTSRALLGLIAVVAIQRAINKVLISVVLSREFKHDETNRAWWTGRWYNRGLVAHVISQPAREFVVKIIELSLWSSDIIVGHLLLFMMTPLILVPFADTIHATALFWLRPSKQIRPPLYGQRQKQKRRWIIITYGSLYAAVITVFVVLLAIPVILHSTTSSNCTICDNL